MPLLLFARETFLAKDLGRDRKAQSYYKVRGVVSVNSSKLICSEQIPSILKHLHTGGSQRGSACWGGREVTLDEKLQEIPVSAGVYLYKDRAGKKSTHRILPAAHIPAASAHTMPHPKPRDAALTL